MTDKLELPDGWTSVNLTDILTKEQLRELHQFNSDSKRLNIKPLDSEFIRGLKIMFRKWKTELNSKNINPDFLAYCVANEFNKHAYR